MQPAVIGLPSTQATPQLPAPDEVGREDFLRMLIAQLEHQDPLDPQDATEFTAQLAQFSSLDQLVSMRTAIEGLATRQSQSDALSAASLIGHEALVQGSRFDVGDSTAPMPTLTLDLSGAADVTSVEVLNASGHVVATAANIGSLPQGQHALAWSDFDQQPATGTYSYRATVAPGDPNPTLMVRSPVTGAALDPGGTVLLFGSVGVPLSALQEIGR